MLPTMGLVLPTVEIATEVGTSEAVVLQEAAGVQEAAHGHPPVTK